MDNENIISNENIPQIVMQESEDITTMMVLDLKHKVTFGSATHIGKRSEQQDSTAVDSDYDYIENGRAMAAVCDGMGGLSGGNRASALCASIVKEDFHNFGGELVAVPDFLRSLAVKVDREVFLLKNDKGAPLMAGTTLVSVYIFDDKLFWLSVGDSHIYIARGNDIVTANSDHNYLMYLKDKVIKGEMTLEEAEAHPKKEALISYIGMGGVKLMDISYKPFTLLSGDRILLCSDGLYRTLDIDEIQIILEENTNPQDAADDLVRTAINRGLPHQDNTTAVVVAFD